MAFFPVVFSLLLELVVGQIDLLKFSYGTLEPKFDRDIYNYILHVPDCTNENYHLAPLYLVAESLQASEWLVAKIANKEWKSKGSLVATIDAVEHIESGHLKGDVATGDASTLTNVVKMGKSVFSGGDEFLSQLTITASDPGSSFYTQTYKVELNATREYNDFHLHDKDFCVWHPFHSVQEASGIFKTDHSTVVDCKGKWTDWTSCSVTCGYGTRMRHFLIENYKRNGGAECSFDENQVEFERCHFDEHCSAEQADCEGDFTLWGKCMAVGPLGEMSSSTIANCGEEGMRKRVYQVESFAKFNGRPCPRYNGYTEQERCMGSCGYGEVTNQTRSMPPCESSTTSTTPTPELLHPNARCDVVNAEKDLFGVCQCRAGYFSRIKGMDVVENDGDAGDEVIDVFSTELVYDEHIDAYTGLCYKEFTRDDVFNTQVTLPTPEQAATSSSSAGAILPTVACKPGFDGTIELDEANSHWKGYCQVKYRCEIPHASFQKIPAEALSPTPNGFIARSQWMQRGVPEETINKAVAENKFNLKRCVCNEGYWGLIHFSSIENSYIGSCNEEPSKPTTPTITTTFKPEFPILAATDSGEMISMVNQHRQNCPSPLEAQKMIEDLLDSCSIDPNLWPVNKIIQHTFHRMVSTVNPILFERICISPTCRYRIEQHFEKIALCHTLDPVETDIAYGGDWIGSDGAPLVAGGYSKEKSKKQKSWWQLAQYETYLKWRTVNPGYEGGGESGLSDSYFGIDSFESLTLHTLKHIILVMESAKDDCHTVSSPGNVEKGVVIGQTFHISGVDTDMDTTLRAAESVYRQAFSKLLNHPMRRLTITIEPDKKCKNSVTKDASICATAQCGNFGVCVPGSDGNSYACQCNECFEEVVRHGVKTCEFQENCVKLKNPCAPNPCSCGGECVLKPCSGHDCDLRLPSERYTCNCPMGFKGQHCQIPSCPSGYQAAERFAGDACGMCVPISSANAAALVQEEAEASGTDTALTGLLSSTRNPCSTNPCMNGGVCEIDASREGYVCKCLTAGWGGYHCEEHVCPEGYYMLDDNHHFKCLKVDDSHNRAEDNICDPNPCNNGGICKKHPADPSKFECLCTNNFRGTFCDDEINHCEAYPCPDEFTCTRDSRVAKGYFCQCEHCVFDTAIRNGTSYEDYDVTEEAIENLVPEAAVQAGNGARRLNSKSRSLKKDKARIMETVESNMHGHYVSKEQIVETVKETFKKRIFKKIHSKQQNSKKRNLQITWGTDAFVDENHKRHSHSGEVEKRRWFSLEDRLVEKWEAGKMVPKTFDLTKRKSPLCPVFQRPDPMQTAKIQLQVKCPVTDPLHCEEIFSKLEHMSKDYSYLENEIKRNCIVSKVMESSKPYEEVLESGCPSLEEVNRRWGPLYEVCRIGQHVDGSNWIDITQPEEVALQMSSDGHETLANVWAEKIWCVNPVCRGVAMDLIGLFDDCSNSARGKMGLLARKFKAMRNSIKSCGQVEGDSVLKQQLLITGSIDSTSERELLYTEDYVKKFLQKEAVGEDAAVNVKATPVLMVNNPWSKIENGKVNGPVAAYESLLDNAYRPISLYHPKGTHARQNLEFSCENQEKLCVKTLSPGEDWRHTVDPDVNLYITFNDLLSFVSEDYEIELSPLAGGLGENPGTGTTVGGNLLLSPSRGEVIISGETMIIKPPFPLVAQTEYKVAIPSGFVTGLKSQSQNTYISYKFLTGRPLGSVVQLSITVGCSGYLSCQYYLSYLDFKNSFPTFSDDLAVAVENFRMGRDILEELAIIEEGKDMDVDDDGVVTEKDLVASKEDIRKIEEDLSDQYQIENDAKELSKELNKVPEEESDAETNAPGTPEVIETSDGVVISDSSPADGGAITYEQHAITTNAPPKLHTDIHGKVVEHSSVSSVAQGASFTNVPKFGFILTTSTSTTTTGLFSFSFGGPAETTTLMTQRETTTSTTTTTTRASTTTSTTTTMMVTTTPPPTTTTTTTPAEKFGQLTFSFGSTTTPPPTTTTTTTMPPIITTTLPPVTPTTMTPTTTAIPTFTTAAPSKAQFGFSFGTTKPPVVITTTATSTTTAASIFGFSLGEPATTAAPAAITTLPPTTTTIAPTTTAAAQKFGLSIGRTAATTTTTTTAANAFGFSFGGSTETTTPAAAKSGFNFGGGSTVTTTVAPVITTTAMAPTTEAPIETTAAPSSRFGFTIGTATTTTTAASVFGFSFGDSRATTTAAPVTTAAKKLAFSGGGSTATTTVAPTTTAGASRFGFSIGTTTTTTTTTARKVSFGFSFGRRLEKTKIWKRRLQEIRNTFGRVDKAKMREQFRLDNENAMPLMETNRVRHGTNRHNGSFIKAFPSLVCLGVSIFVIQILCAVCGKFVVQKARGADTNLINTEEETKTDRARTDRTWLFQSLVACIESIGIAIVVSAYSGASIGMLAGCAILAHRYCRKAECPAVVNESKEEEATDYTTVIPLVGGALAMFSAAIPQFLRTTTNYDIISLVVVGFVSTMLSKRY